MTVEAATPLCGLLCNPIDCKQSYISDTEPSYSCFQHFFRHRSKARRSSSSTFIGQDTRIHNNFHFQLRRRSSTSPNVFLSICPCVVNWSECMQNAPEFIQNVEECMQNVPEYSWMHAECSKMFMNACRMFQNVPECKQIHA